MLNRSPVPGSMLVAFGLSPRLRGMSGRSMSASTPGEDGGQQQFSKLSPKLETPNLLRQNGFHVELQVMLASEHVLRRSSNCAQDWPSGPQTLQRLGNQSRSSEATVWIKPQARHVVAETEFLWRQIGDWIAIEHVSIMARGHFRNYVASAYSRHPKCINRLMA